MLTAAWLVKGTACGWGFLRSASPGRPVRATVAAATRLRDGARRGDPPVPLAASLSDRAALPFPSWLCAERSHRLRLRPHGREQLPNASASRWGPFCCCPRGAREPHRSHSSDDSTPGRPAAPLEQGAGRAKSRGVAELVGALRGHFGSWSGSVCRVPRGWDGGGGTLRLSHHRLVQPLAKLAYWRGGWAGMLLPDTQLSVWKESSC